MSTCRFKVWVRLTPIQSVFTYVWAANAYEAKKIAEAQYGAGNVLGWWQEEE
jgi:hypothetical protein